MKYVVNMLAKPEKVTVSQINASVDGAMDLYFKNSIACFASVKQFNEDLTPVLCADFDVPEKYKAYYDKLGAKIEKVPFDLEVSSKSNWSICNYRYCVMKRLCEVLEDEDYVLMLDTDVVCVDNLAPLFEDVWDDLFLFDVNHSIRNRDRYNIILNYEKIYGEKCNLIHYGGEFICCKVKVLKELYKACVEMIKDSLKFDDLINFNDEHITSIAVYRSLKDKAHNAEAYIYRYWTKGFYLVSTNYFYNSVLLWHLPVEKDYGMLKVFAYYDKKGKIPPAKKMAFWFGFPPKRRNHLIYFVLDKIKRKIFKK